jgi:hypothetical protein
LKSFAALFPVPSDSSTMFFGMPHHRGSSRRQSPDSLAFGCYTHELYQISTIFRKGE